MNLLLAVVTTVLIIDAKFGLGIELAKLATNESENEDDYDIVIQRVTSAENARHVQ